MSVTLLRKTRESTYLGLVLRFPLKPIRSDKQAARAHEVLSSLMDRGRLSSQERDYMQVLARLVEAYEEERHPMDAVSGEAMLAHLLEARGITQADLARRTGIAESTISAVLGGARKLSLAHVRKLAACFKVDPSVFVASLLLPPNTPRGPRRRGRCARRGPA